MSRPRRLIAVLAATAVVALLIHALPLLLWHLRFEQELGELGHPERLHSVTRSDFPPAPALWTELRVDNLSLRAPLGANQLMRCGECASRCVLRLQDTGTLAIFDGPPELGYGDALDKYAPDARDLSLLRTVARNWETIDALTDRARTSAEVPESFRFTAPAAAGIVTAFRVQGVPRFVVYAYAPSGEPTRVIGVAGVERPMLEQILGSLRIASAEPTPIDAEGILSECGAAASDAAEQPRATVVLLHGLARSAASMSDLEDALSAHGYRVINLDYPSTQHSIDDLVAILEGELDRCCRAGPAPVHFVTHSLGGILVRAYLARNAFEPLGRVVMLSPPNQGSELVDAFGDSPLYELVLGPAGQELGTDATSVPRALPAVNFELGIITGDRSVNPVGAWLLPGENDGTVSVESARVAGMKDFLVLPENHTFIMDSPRVAEEIVHFLEKGRFSSTAP
ncbi:MAG TPA: alpha/beta fold hydrolase [Myxococcota bacterium]